MRFRRSAVVLCLLLGGAGFAFAQPAPAPKVAPLVVVSVNLKAAMDKEQTRIAPKVTADQRLKLQKAARAAAAEIDVQLAKTKTMKPGDVSPIVRKAALGSGIDFSQMPIEDAIMLMFMLVSEDARNDMRAQLDEMNAARLRRSALRDAEQQLKEEQAEMRAAARAQYARDRHAKVVEALGALLKVDPFLADAGAPK